MPRFEPVRIKMNPPDYRLEKGEKAEDWFVKEGESAQMMIEDAERTAQMVKKEIIEISGFMKRKVKTLIAIVEGLSMKPGFTRDGRFCPAGSASFMFTVQLKKTIRNLLATDLSLPALDLFFDEVDIPDEKRRNLEVYVEKRGILRQIHKRLFGKKNKELDI